MTVRLRPAGDSAWLVELPDRIDPAINTRAVEIAALVRRSSLPVVDVVVGYRSVMVYVDPLAADARLIETTLRTIAASPSTEAAAPGAQMTVPVCYDGPDLADVAAFAKASIEEVIARHLAREYRVYVVGFVPGFAYMASVDPTIAAPRRATPRVTVPPGSVAVAAGQTGIYPAATPGGWHLIGRCPLKPYDPDRDAPFLFHAGDRVRFTRVSDGDYRATTEWGDA